MSDFDNISEAPFKGGSAISHIGIRCLTLFHPIPLGGGTTVSSFLCIFVVFVIGRHTPLLLDTRCCGDALQIPHPSQVIEVLTHSNPLPVGALQRPLCGLRANR